MVPVCACPVGESSHAAPASTHTASSVALLRTKLRRRIRPLTKFEIAPVIEDAFVVRFSCMSRHLGYWGAVARRHASYTRNMGKRHDRHCQRIVTTQFGRVSAEWHGWSVESRRFALPDNFCAIWIEIYCSLRIRKHPCRARTNHRCESRSSLRKHM